MALRIVEVVVDQDKEDEIREAVKDLKVHDLWCSQRSEDKITLRILVSAETTEDVFDALSDRFAGLENFRLVIIDVLATLPHIEEEVNEAADGPAVEEGDPKAERWWIKRISSDELYDEVQDSSKLTAAYLITIALSVLVAAIGLMQDNVAVVIGAMVIAPLLGPNIAMSLATTLGDSKLLKRSAITMTAGVLLALGISLVIGMIFEVDTNTSEIFLRTEIGLTDIVLALASGAAGALFFTIGTSTALVGVMVAVALLPPLVTLGLLIGSGQLDLAFETLLLFMTNFICVNLAAVGVFVLQGIKPRRWWESVLAKRSVSFSLLIWIALLVFMIVLIVLYA